MGIKQKAPYAGLVIALAAAGLAQAADMPALDPNDLRIGDRKALRDLLLKTEQAFNKVDVDAVIGVLDKDAVVVWQDAVRTASHQQVRDHYKRTFEGAGGAILKSMSIKAALTAPARFYGNDYAIAYGTTKENYELVGGLKVSLDGLWTTHLAKHDGAWKVTALHFSTNPFANDVVRQAGQSGWIFGVVGVVAGLVLGWLIGRRRKAA